jgi:hypothetical protein
MSECIPGTMYDAERTMHASVEERHRWADAQRLNRQVKRERRHRFYFGLLASLGGRFTTWGERLQERYANPDSASLTQSA